MASTVQKKLVVCGGNGFLGMYGQLAAVVKLMELPAPASTGPAACCSPARPTQLALLHDCTLTAPRKPHLSRRRPPRLVRRLHLPLRHTALVLSLVLARPTPMV